MLVGADVILSILQEYRLCWVSGRFSGGKTLFALLAAHHFLKKGYRLVSTTRTVWADSLSDVFLEVWKDGEKPKLRAFVILDEGGLYFDNSKSVMEICAYAAKMDVIYLIPSFFPPNRFAQVVNIQPEVNLYSAGIPLVYYKWAVKLGSFRDSGFFLSWRSSVMWGIYSRQDPAASPERLVNFLKLRMTEYRGAFGYGDEQDGVSALADGRGQDGATAASLAISDAALTFADAAETIARIKAVSKRGRRR